MLDYLVKKGGGLVMMAVAFVMNLFGVEYGIDPTLAENISDGGLNTGDWIELVLFSLGATKAIRTERKSKMR